MLKRTRTLLSTAVMAGCAAAAYAADPTTQPSSALEPTPSASARDTEPLESRAADPKLAVREDRTPLMMLLNEAGLAKPLEDARLRVYGHVEASYTYNFAEPPGDPARYNPLPGRGFSIPTEVDNPGRVFDVEHDDPTLNQITLNLDRIVPIQNKEWDFGGRMELMYGGDARFIHGNGLGDHHADDVSTRTTGGPDEEFDLVQLYGDINVPIGNGLRVRAGKFTYFKELDPNNSVFYSHSFTFGGALPFTLTGVYGTYLLDEQWQFDLGISRGWDQALEDNNDAISFFGRVRYDVNDDTYVAAKFITGPEQADDDSNYRTVINLTLSHMLNEKTQIFVDGILGMQADGQFLSFDAFGTPVFEEENAYWYGVAGYVVYNLNEQFRPALRAEWYRDDGGYTTAVDQSLFALTAGVTIFPFPQNRWLNGMMIRPEVRWDYSTERFFDGFSSHHQCTAAIDVVFNF